MTHALGIDLGGTKVLAGVVDPKSGEVIASAKRRSKAEESADEVVSGLISVAKDALKKSSDHKKEIGEIGIGVAGQIDRKSGEIINAPNIVALHGFPLAATVEKELGRPVKLFNDVEAAAAGEARFGAGKSYKDFLVIFVGTGIGGAIYVGGEPRVGASGTAGEIGHTTLVYGGRVCSCGGLGHLEAYASRTSLVRTILAGMHLGRESSLRKVALHLNPDDPGTSGIRSGALAEAVEKKDQLALEMISDAARYLGAGLSSAINFYNPPLIILGGGLIDAVDIFFDIAKRTAAEGSLPTPRPDVKIVKASLGDYSGVVGAAHLAASG